MIVKQKECLGRLCPEREQTKRIRRLKGGLEITLPTRHYSLKENGDFIYLLRDREEISHFGKGVAGETVTNYASGYEAKLRKEKERREKIWWLKEYCEDSMGSCVAADFDCDKCKSSHKEWALERKKEGKKVVRPGRKKEEFMKAIEERNALLKQADLKNKVRFFERIQTGKWR